MGQRARTWICPHKLGQVRISVGPAPGGSRSSHSQQRKFQFCQTGCAWLGCGHLRHQERRQQKDTGRPAFYLIHLFPLLLRSRYIGTLLVRFSTTQSTYRLKPARNYKLPIRVSHSMGEKIRAETKTDSGWAEARVDLFASHRKKIGQCLAADQKQKKKLAEMGARL